MLISFDFDNTLWDESTFSFTRSLNTLKEHLAQGNRVVVVTSRKNVFAHEAQILLSRAGINVEVFSCPWDLDNGETWEDKWKRGKIGILIANLASGFTLSFPLLGMAVALLSTATPFALQVGGLLLCIYNYKH